MKLLLSFVLIYALMVEAIVSSELTDVNITGKSFSTDFDLCEIEKGDEVPLSRKKRYLTFPEGSTFLLTLSVVKAIVVQMNTPTNWVLEYDTLWPIPSHPWRDHDDNFKKIKKADNRISYKNIKRPSRWQLNRRHKRELYSTYEAALDSQGLPGKNCILRTICEAQSVLSPPGVSFVEDILRIILSNVARFRNEMDEYDKAYESKKNCDLKFPCPFSLLEFLLSYDQNLIE